MTLLNVTSDGLPNILVVLHAAVMRAGSGGLSETYLLETIAPESFVEDGGGKARETLNTWIKLGLFRREGNQILTDPFAGESIRKASAVALRDATRRGATRAALSVSSNPDLWGTAGAADFTRALAWMMTLDVHKVSFQDLQKLEAEQLTRTDRSLIQNVTNRLPWLKQWARFLGFSRESFADIDPTVALRDALPEIIAPGQSMTADAFLERVAAALPVLDGGAWQTEVLTNISPGPEYSRTSGAVSPALSRAILSLRASRELILRQRSDSGSFMILSGVQGPRSDLTFHEVERSAGE